MKVWDNVKYGLPLEGVRIIDSHGHFGEYYSFYSPEYGAAATNVRLMDDLGIECSFVSPMDGWASDFKRGNLQTAEMLKTFYGRLYGYICLNPTYTEEMVPELEKYREVPGFKGIKFHISINKTPMNSPKYGPALEYADHYGMVVLMHTYGADAALSLVPLADKYKNAKFIAAHSEVGIDSVARLADAVNVRENLYLDTALAGASEGSIELLAKYVDNKKILFGTDIGFYSPNFSLGRIAMADIEDEAKLDIMGRNAARLFNI